MPPGNLLFTRQSDYIVLEDFVRRAYHTSAIADNWLYIDGGEETVTINDQSVARPLNKTLSIDLSTSWTNQSVKIIANEKPRDCPNLNYSYMWLNPQDSVLYAFGGESSDIPPTTPPFSVSAWKLTPNGHGGGNWSEALGLGNTGSITRPVGSLVAASAKASYYVGGYSSFQSSPENHDLGFDQYIPLPGVVSFNYDLNKWSNTSSTGYSAAGTAQCGGMHYVPYLGPAGAFILIGGDISSAERFVFSKTPRTFYNITIYEPESQTWYHQTATGDTPSPRVQFCVVGLSGGDNSTYEIFIYGGWDYSVGDSTLDQIFVLSLPAFRWFRADYTPSMSRSSHTCHVVGNRQLLSIGGLDMVQWYMPPQKPDPFLQGLAIFDLSEMVWKGNYNASAAPYTRPSVVEAYYKAQASQLLTWDQPALKQLFSSFPLDNISRTSVLSTTPTQPASSPSSITSSSGKVSQPNHAPRPGSIAGIIVGVISALVIVALSFYFIANRNSRSKEPKETRNTNESPPEPQPEADGNSTSEVDDTCFRPQVTTSATIQELAHNHSIWPFELAVCHPQETGGQVEAADIMER